MAVQRGFATLASLLLAGTLFAPTVLASPLGLVPGDKVAVIEFDALNQDGNGGSFTKGTPGILVADGDITSVVLAAGSPSSSPIIEPNVTFNFNGELDLTSTTPLGGSVFFIQANFLNPSSGPAFSVAQGGLGTILEGDFNIPLTISGTLNLADSVFTMAGGANIQITGGDPTLVAALGGIGGGALLELASGVFNFLPPLNVVGADGNIFNDNFTFALSGTVTPQDSSPFVPEPSSAILLAAGLLGLVAAGRRRAQR